MGLQPMGPLDDPFVDTNGMAGVPLHYVTCTADRIIAPTHKDAMIDGWPGTTRAALSTGHLPQFTATEELTSVLKNVLA